MVEPINLNKVRKARAKAQRKSISAENRVRFGRTKAETLQQAADARKQARDVDGHKREP